MKKQISEQVREGLYEELIKGAQDLARRVSANEGSSKFDDFVADHNDLLYKYIMGFNSLSPEQYQRASSIINLTKQYIHGTLDVTRIREMRNALEMTARKEK